VQSELASAGQSDRGHEPEALVADGPGDVDSLGFQFGDSGLRAQPSSGYSHLLSEDGKLRFPSNALFELEQGRSRFRAGHRAGRDFSVANLVVGAPRASKSGFNRGTTARVP
jgi:hypothetical protein